MTNFPYQPAQLNVDVDALASSHISTSANPFSTLYPLFPHTCAHLELAHSTVHSHYRQYLHTAFSHANSNDECVV